MVNSVDQDVSGNNQVIDEQTDFKAIVIENNYPCLLNGNWTAVNVNGKTLYQGSDGKYFTLAGQTEPYSGPVNICNANLTISTGADVKGAYIFSPNGGGYSVTVQQGGTLEDSNVYNGTLTVAKGGFSKNNNYISEQATIDGRSDNDTFVDPGSGVYAQLKLTGYQGDTVSNNNQFAVSDGSNSLTVTGEVNHPHLTDISAHNPNAVNTINTRIRSSGKFGNVDVAVPDVNQYLEKYTISNDYYNIVAPRDGYTVYVGSENGQTVYTDRSGQTLYKGDDPVNLIGVHFVIVQKGATLKGANILGGSPGTNNTRLVILDGGTMEDSNFYDGYLGIEHGGISKNNKYFSLETGVSDWNSTNYLMNGLSENDTYYEGNGTVRGTLQLTGTNHPPAGRGFYVTNGLNNIRVDSQGQLINPIVATGGSDLTVSYRKGSSVGTCYLSGTLIEIEGGVKPIEDIIVGDEIYVYNDGKKQLKPVTWVGSRHYTVREALPDDEAGYAVSIVKDAFAPGVPYKTMRVTSEHCFFINNQFIPIRMLVNGRSIYYDYDLKSYTYYHIELDEHSIIKADGVLAESYLNTTNHQDFYINSNLFHFKNTTKTWEKDAAAPLVTDRAIVEPIYRSYIARSLSLGTNVKQVKCKTTYDADLHLVTDQGRKLYACRYDKGQGIYVFVLPAQVRYVHLVSRSSRPSDAIGPFVDDRRQLGVLVGDITIFDRKNLNSIKTHLEIKDLLGWHNQEDIPCRWTDGYALLPLNDYLQDHVNILTFKILAAGPYVMEEGIEESKKIVNE